MLVIESHALLVSALGIGPAARFLKDLDESNTIIVRGALSTSNALKILFRYDDKVFSFADAISFTIMERLSIPLAFTFDNHFVQCGFSVLTSRNLDDIFR
ncbi:MAG: hypothetical protein EPO21_15945 [Chloroflexota bacterium]|nr:MAG: hypothetical protein EPO21_15945 [Chloroflexota bacterium]